MWIKRRRGSCVGEEEGRSEEEYINNNINVKNLMFKQHQYNIGGNIMRVEIPLRTTLSSSISIFFFFHFVLLFVLLLLFLFLFHLTTYFDNYILLYEAVEKYNALIIFSIIYDNSFYVRYTHIHILNVLILSTKQYLNAYL